MHGYRKNNPGVYENFENRKGFCNEFEYSGFLRISERFVDEVGFSEYHFNK